MKKIINTIVGCLYLALFCQSCKQSPEMPVKISRMEQSLFSIPIDSIAEYIPQLKEQYGELFDLYSNRVLFLGSPSAPYFSHELTKFLADPDMTEVYKKVMEVFPNMSEFERKLGKAFFNYRKIFPDKVIPSIYTLTSGFNQSIITADTILAIALDKYLGANDEFYFMLGLANYQRQVMNPENLVADCMKAWLYTEFPYNDSIDNAIGNIIYEGKIMYALRQILPKEPDSLIFGFTPAQIRWCKNNTAQMWTFLVENRLLFSTDQLTINKLISPAPFCSLFTRESPGRAVVWLGYRIISSYVKHNRITLKELLLDDDYQQILTKAKFKP